ncbi:hypothetical protein GMRT_12236 [Giardia muris]|uniref:Uncharacterized protein n=1 Tax=Giardia muris TaxID=5742 RepID=A0A4Z1SYR3_GIAMU|nr:hypothetical protein GMRT_12236 [Giardia muris]|eukprot:TNJ30610.1 hypothetical protein GMRT_12236 [Giardia muris]
MSLGVPFSSGTRITAFADTANTLEIRVPHIDRPSGHRNDDFTFDRIVTNRRSASASGSSFGAPRYTYSQVGHPETYGLAGDFFSFDRSKALSGTGSRRASSASRSMEPMALTAGTSNIMKELGKHSFYPRSSDVGLQNTGINDQPGTRVFGKLSELCFTRPRQLIGVIQTPVRPGPTWTARPSDLPKLDAHLPLVTEDLERRERAKNNHGRLYCSDIIAPNTSVPASVGHPVVPLVTRYTTPRSSLSGKLRAASAGRALASLGAMSVSSATSVSGTSLYQPVSSRPIGITAGSLVKSSMTASRNGGSPSVSTAPGTMRISSDFGTAKYGNSSFH